MHTSSELFFDAVAISYVPEEDLITDFGSHAPFSEYRDLKMLQLPLVLNRQAIKE